MAEDPKDQVNDKEAERRFQETLGRLVNTPHKPHAPLGAVKRGSSKRRAKD